MNVNLLKSEPPNKKKEIKKQNYYSTILQLKVLFRFLRDPSIIVIIFFVIVSGLLIISPSSFSGNPNYKINWPDICQNVGFDLLGGVFAFVGFDVIWIRLKELERQQGVQIDYFNKSEFISKVRQLKSYNRFSSQPRVTVRILETWTELLRDANYKERLSEAILRCAENNNEIEILLLNPENRDLVEARSSDLQSISNDFSSINIRNNLYINLKEIQKIIQQLEPSGNQNRLKVKLYNNIPSLAMYMCKPYLFVTFFRAGELTTMSQQLKLHIDSPVSEFINQRFDQIWKDPKTISLEDCLYVKLDIIKSGKFHCTYDRIKYIVCDRGYYIQNAKLFRHIANRTDIHIRIDDKFFKPKDVEIDDLPAIVQKLFCSKYIKHGELFLFLESMN